jgi:hypothetical protein
MSHFTTIDIQIKDLNALRSACAELHLELVPNAEARGYGTNRLKGDYVIRLKGPYDVALQRQPDNTYRLVADLWEGHVEREVGTGFGRLKQLYGVHKTVREARLQGLNVRRQNLADGRIRLAIVRV